MRGWLKHDFDVVMRQVEDDIEKAATETADEVTTGLKNELRDDVIAAGLGTRVANAWRGRRYPEGRMSMSAAAFVWTKAPDIIDAFDRGPIIRTVNGRRYLAIPTPNVPADLRRRGRKKGANITALVENYFNQDLRFARAGNGRLIAYIDAIGTGRGRGFQTGGKALGPFYRGQKGLRRHVQVVMFVLTPTVKMPKKFDIDSVANAWGARATAIFTSKLRGT